HKARGLRARLAAFALALSLVPWVASMPILAVAQTASPTVQQGAPLLDYPLGPGDVIRIQVFQSPDLEVEARVSETGTISFPLLGAVRVGGLSPLEAEQLIARRLREGNFLQNPQVTLNVLQFRSQQVSVLGSVNKPGRYPLETTNMRLSEVLALAGGISPGGADIAILMSQRDGRPVRTE